MTTPTTTHSTTPLGYGALIAEAIGSADDAVLDLVEEFMRTETGGTLDALDAATFDRLARDCMADVVAWDLAGVEGVTLARYCETMGLAYPAALDEDRDRVRGRDLTVGGEPAQDPAPHHPCRG